MKRLLFGKNFTPFTTCLIFFLFVTLFGNKYAHSQPVRGVTDDTIKVGVVIAMTGPGASTLLPYQEAFKNYFRHINEQGGIHGRKVKLIIEDDRFTIPAAIAAYKKLVYKDRVLAILGMGGSGQHKALYDRIENDKVPVIAAAWSHHVTRPLKRYSFQPTNDNIDEIKMIVEYIAKNTIKEKLRLAYVYVDVETAKSGLEQLEESVKHYGLELLTQEVHNLGDMDVTPQVMRLKKKKINHIIALSGGPGFFALFRDSRKFGYSPVVISSLHLMGEDTVRVVREAARNLYGISCVASWYDNEPEIAKMREITLRYHPESKEPNYVENFGSHRYHSKGWLGAMIFTEGAKKAGKDLNHETLVAGFEKIKDFDTGGLSGPISFGPNRRKANDCGKFYKADVEKNRFVPISGWVRPAH